MKGEPLDLDAALETGSHCLAGVTQCVKGTAVPCDLAWLVVSSHTQTLVYLINRSLTAWLYVPVFQSIVWPD